MFVYVYINSDVMPTIWLYILTLNYKNIVKPLSLVFILTRWKRTDDKMVGSAK